MDYGNVWVSLNPESAMQPVRNYVNIGVVSLPPLSVNQSKCREIGLIDIEFTSYDALQTESWLQDRYTLNHTVLS